ncbi:MAG TPA: TIGR03943 family protein [Anaerolineales bacterium]|nr:TIGR03943 family protein [Anaerolineales bacterium]
MSPRIYKTLQALVLAGLGIFLLQKIWSGTLYWYISNRFMLLTLLAAIVFLALAQSVLPKRKPAEAGSPTSLTLAEVGDFGFHEHDHGQAAPVWGLVVVALPVILGLLVPAKPLGAAAIANKGINTSAPLVAASNQTLRLDIAPEERNILDWIRALNYSSNPAALNGQPADVIGFVYQDSRLGDDEFLVGRFTLNCCVADALAIGMVVKWPEAKTLPANSWVRVTGPVEAAELNGQRLPRITAESVETVPEPSQPYLYP